MERQESARQILPFSDQFKNREVMNDGLSNVEVVDIVPNTPTGNPVIYNLGWGGRIEGCKPFYQGFYEGDKRVISVQYPSHDPQFKQNELRQGHSEYGFRNAMSVANIVLQKGLERVDIVGHSEGAGVSLMLLPLLEEHRITVDNIVLVNPVGFKNFNLPEGALKIAKMMLHEGKLKKKNPELKAFTKENDKYLIKSLRHPLNFLHEGTDVGTIDLSELLKSAYQNQHVGIVQAGGDPLVSYQDVGSGVELTKQKERVDSVAELRTDMPDILTNHDTREAFENEIVKLNEKEIESPLIVPVPESEEVGHLFSGFYPKANFYVPLVVDILNYFRTGEVK